LGCEANFACHRGYVVRPDSNQGSTGLFWSASTGSAICSRTENGEENLWMVSVPGGASIPLQCVEGNLKKHILQSTGVVVKTVVQIIFITDRLLK